MKKQDFAGTLMQASVDKTTSYQQMLAVVNSAAESFRDSCGESASSFLRGMEASANRWQLEMESLVRAERQSIQQTRDAMTALREKDWEEVAKLRKKFWEWWAMSVMAATLLTGLAAISMLWILPYKALPMATQARAEQMATAEMELARLKAQLAAEQSKLDQMTSMEEKLQFLSTRMSQTKDDPNGIWVRAPQGYQTSPIPTGETWIQIR